MNIPYNGKSPSIHESVFVAPGAYLIGDVQVGKDSSIWFNAVLRPLTVPLSLAKDAVSKRIPLSI